MSRKEINSASHDGLPLISPDLAEEDFSDQTEDGAPIRFHHQPVIALGGSAGALKAFLKFFELMPPDSGAAFVVALHFPPSHETNLDGILQQRTAMPVRIAADKEALKANHVYIIPPGKHLTITDGHLKLTDIVRERGRRVAVDLLFRSLGDTHGSNAIAIIVSGMDSDGAIGIKRIKERGGLTIAQEPSEAESPEMPRSAIGTGMTDWVLPVADMPLRLLEYLKLQSRLRLPPETDPAPGSEEENRGGTERDLQDILAFLRTRTGRDFSSYKRATILRRISRRMRVNSVEDLGSYMDFLRTHPGEAGALLQDLLISVTNFFRDRKAFDALTARIPELFEGKSMGDFVRVWVPACATGEEAYSIGMLLSEYASTLPAPPALQIFATDLDESAIQIAREGVYPETIAADVSEERLRRFFVRERHGYHIRRELRETILFAAHDVLKDSPFSKLDLISCRNLLIYLNRAAQTQVFEIFHFALKPEGRLFLGSSDSVEDGSPLFSVVDKKARIYSPRLGARSRLPVPLRYEPGPGEGHARDNLRERPMGLSNWAPASKTAALTIPGPRGAEGQSVSWNELHLRLLDHFAPPSLVVDAEYEIMHLSEGARTFLQFAGGEPSRNLLRVVHPALRIELRALLYGAGQSQKPAQADHVALELDGKPTLINIRVSPAPKIAPGFFLVVLEESKLEGAAPSPASTENTPATQQLERELESVKSHLGDVVEQYEASTEELKASNEELQAINEELRSATEELETSREELQSINEELTTVNHELKNNVDQLAHANSDLRNLMASTAIATIFLDREFHITRFTPPAVDIFKFIPSDLGRPLSDLAHELNYAALRADAAQVLEQLIPVEREVSNQAGHWFLARLLPYRTAEDRIDGVVLTFVDITERRKTAQALLEANRQLADNNRELEAKVKERTSRLADIVGELEGFSYTIAHDLRAPLRTMRGFAELLLTEKASILDAEGLDYIQRINNAAERLDRLIRDILTYSRTVKHDLPLSPINMANLLSELIASYPHLRQPNVKIVLEQPFPMVLGNSAALTQCFSNLMSNGIKFVRPGENPFLRIYAERDGEKARFWVEDKGIGIAPEHREKIFELFEQLQPGAYDGGGIGLAIVRKAVERMNGRVGVESSLGTGSRFWIELKLAPV